MNKRSFIVMVLRKLDVISCSDYPQSIATGKLQKFIQVVTTFYWNNNVSLQLLVQNRTRKWHFPLNFQNGIN